MTKRISSKKATANCLAILKQLTVQGRVDHKAFLNEMDARSLAAYGHKCTSDQYALLGRMVAAYEQSL